MGGTQEANASQGTAVLDVSVLGKAVPFFHCQMDDPVLRLPPERLMLEKTSFSQMIPLICLSGEERKQQNTLGCQPGNCHRTNSCQALPQCQKHSSLGTEGCRVSQATSIAWPLVFGGSTVPFQVLLYPQVNVQEQSHIIAESNPSLCPSLVPCQGSEEPCREEGSPCESSQERHRQQSRGSHHLRRE